MRGPSVGTPGSPEALAISTFAFSLLYSFPLMLVSSSSTLQLSCVIVRPSLILRRTDPTGKLIIYKTDVAEAYRLCPMHPLWQLKQIVSVDGTKHVDRCNNFGGARRRK